MSNTNFNPIKHPATYSEHFIEIFAKYLHDKKNVYDPFGGTGKISLIKEHGFQGKIYCSEIEPEWTNVYKSVDTWFIVDSAKTEFISDEFFEAICTSPTYGNRMADHFESKDSSKRITYRHGLGRNLTDGNTGKMQWGQKYQDKHIEIYVELYRVLQKNGLFILNISDHIRAGKIVPVSEWHKKTLETIGFKLQETLNIETKRMGFGENSKLRVSSEQIFIFTKI